MLLYKVPAWIDLLSIMGDRFICWNSLVATYGHQARPLPDSESVDLLAQYTSSARALACAG